MTAKRRRLLAIVAMMLVDSPALSSQPVTTSSTYVNAKYGFKVVLPPKYEACRSSSPNPNHGISVSTAALGGCDITSRDILPSIFAAYNADETASLEELASKSCLAPQATWRHVGMSGLAGIACLLKANGPDQRREGAVFLRKTGKEKSDYIQYIVYSTADRSHLNLSLSTLLNSISLINPA